MKFFGKIIGISMILCSVASMTWAATKKKNSKKQEAVETPAPVTDKEEQYDGPLTQTESKALTDLPAFRKHQAEFTEAFQKAKSLVYEKKWTEATDVYLEEKKGLTFFTMFKNGFKRERNSTNIISNTEKEQASVIQSLEEWKEIQQQFSETGKKLTDSISSKNFQQAQADWTAFSEIFEKYAGIRNSIAKSGWAVLTVYDNSKRAGIVDGSYLYITAKTILGYDNDLPTGILGVMDVQINTVLNDMKKNCYDNALECSRNFDSMFQPQSVFSADRKILDVLSRGKEWSQLGIDINQLYEKIRRRNNSNKFRDLYSSYHRLMGCFHDMCENSMDMIEKGNLIGNAEKQAASVGEPSDPIKAFREGNEAYSEQMRTSANIILSNGREINSAKVKWVAKYNPVSGYKSYWGKSLDLYDQASQLVQTKTDSATSVTVTLWKKIAAYYTHAGSLLVEDNRNAIETARSKLPDEIQLDEENFTKTTSDPKGALVLIENVKKNVISDTQVMTTCKNYLEDPSLTVYHSVFLSSIASLTESVDQLQKLTAFTEGMEQKANILYNRFLQSKMNGDIHRRNAQEYFYQKDYDSSLSEVEKAAAEYDEALKFQIDHEVLAIRNKDLLELSDQISKAKFEIVVKNVRQLKNDAESSYYSGNFERALGLLNQAENQWKSITVDADEELENLKILVHSALTMNEGRKLLPTYSNYPEMSQILSQASLNFAAGQELIGNGREAEGKKLLSTALDSLHYLQRSYPLNQDASLLVLRIEQLLDYDNFRKNFAGKIESLKEVNYAKKDMVSQVSYHDLKDLYTLDPNFAGLKQLIDKAEVDLGLKRGAVSASNKTKAANLSTEARNILAKAGTDQAQLEKARAKAKEALNLDPSNAQAKAVTDEVRMKATSTDTGILSAEDEEMYQKASYYYRNNYIMQANDLMNRLWTKESNRRSTKIEKLKRWIDKAL